MPKNGSKGASSQAPHLCAFAPLKVWARLIAENGGVARPYWGRLATVLFASAVTLPLRVLETVLHSGRVRRTEIRHPPVFVMGFARTGTTHLHNLLSRDPNHGFVTTFQAAAPKWFLLGRGRIKRLMQEGMGKQTRPMDNVALSLDFPQEEEPALANATHMSYLHGTTFPSKAREYFDRYMMMGDGSGLPPRVLRRWEAEYMEIVRKATINSEGRRLVLKTPVNQGRVPTLLRMFPDAKFVHVVRNPLVVYLSVVHMYRKVLPLWQMEAFDWDDVHAFLVESYARSMKQFIEDARAIPAGNFAELRFEDLESDPLGELEKVYGGLGLPGWDAARPEVEKYLGSLGTYKKNKYAASSEVEALVRKHWGFAADLWNYS